MIKQPLTAAVLLLAALSFSSALAHGDMKARRGGAVAMANDLGFELVATPDGAAVYVEDHGKPLAPKGLSGKLTVLSGSQKTEADLTATAERLEAKGVKLSPGAKAVAVLTTPNKRVLTVRFSVK